MNNQESKSPINERTLKDIFGDDEVTFSEILNDFIAPSKAIIRELLEGQGANSAEAVKNASHKLKSAAFSVGAEELGELCNTLEFAAGQGDWETINAEASKIEALMQNVETYIEGV